MFNNTLLTTNVTLSYGENFNAANKTDDEVLSKSEITAMQLCHGLLGTVGFLENIGVIFVILLNRIMLDFPSNWFVLSLALSDTVTCIFLNVHVNIRFISHQNVETMAIPVRFLAMATTGSLFTVTLNRYLSVYNSLRYPAIMTTMKAKCLVVIVWIIAFVFSPAYESMPQLAYVVGTYYGALISSNMILNMYILKQARDKRKQIKILERQLQAYVQVRGTKYFMRERVLAFRLLIVFLTFIASTIPMMVFAHVYHNEEYRRSVSVQRNFVWCTVAFQLNSIIDPLVYSIDQPMFKSFLNKIRHRVFPRNVINPSVSFDKDDGAAKISVDQNK